MVWSKYFRPALQNKRYVQIDSLHLISKGAFTPAEHSLRTLENVQEHSQTCMKGFCSHCLSHIYEQLFSNIRHCSHHGTRVIKTFHLCCVDSDTIRNWETPPEEVMWESSFLKGRNYVQLLANLKADVMGLFKNFNCMSSRILIFY